MPRNDGLPFSNHRTCETLTGLTLEHLPRDGSLGRVRQYKRGADVWRADDRADRIYFLRRGQVAVMTNDAHGHEVIMRVIEVGQPFGEICVCSEEKGLRLTTGRAVVESEAIEIKLKDFVCYLQENHDALSAFVFTLCIRLSDAERRTEVLAHRGAEERLGKLLLQLAATRGQPSAAKKDKVALHISHDELAQMAAMSRSHVTVTMGKLRRQGGVEYARNQPLIVNVASLEAHLNDVRAKS